MKIGALHSPLPRRMPSAFSSFYRTTITVCDSILPPGRFSRPNILSSEHEDFLLEKIQAATTSLGLKTCVGMTTFLHVELQAAFPETKGRLRMMDVYDWLKTNQGMSGIPDLNCQ